MQFFIFFFACLFFDFLLDFSISARRQKVAGSWWIFSQLDFWPGVSLIDWLFQPVTGSHSHSIDHSITCASRNSMSTFVHYWFHRPGYWWPGLNQMYISQLMDGQWKCSCKTMTNTIDNNCHKPKHTHYANTHSNCPRNLMANGAFCLFAAKLVRLSWNQLIQGQCIVMHSPSIQQSIKHVTTRTQCADKTTGTYVLMDGTCGFSQIFLFAACHLIRIGIYFAKFNCI